MKATHVLVHGTLALAALGLAYLAWQHPIEANPPEIRILNLGKGDLKSARFEDKSAGTFVGIAPDPAGDGTLVTLSKRAIAGKPENPERIVRGDANAAKLLATLSTLSASRKLGALPEDKQRALGLSPTTRTLTLAHVYGPSRIFHLAPAPEGANEPYLRDPVDGAVYVIARSILSDFDNAPTRLVERHPHAFALHTIDRIQFTAGTKQRSILVKTDAGGAVTLAFAETPETAEADLKKVHDRLFGAWPLDVLGKDELPLGGAPEVVLRVDYAKKGVAVGFFELSNGRQTVSTGQARPLFARTENTLGFIAIPPDLANVLPEIERFVR